MSTLSLNDLSNVIELTTIHVIHLCGGPKKLKEEAYQWYVSKINNYPPGEARHQLEKNLIYFAEATGSSLTQAAQCIYRGEPLLADHQIAPFVERVGQTLPLQNVQPILNFLSGYSSSIEVSSVSRYDWYSLRRFREESDINVYVPVLGMEAMKYQIATKIADNHLVAAVSNRNLSGSGRDLQYAIICDSLFGRVLHASRLIVEFA